MALFYNGNCRGRMEERETGGGGGSCGDQLRVGEKTEANTINLDNGEK